MSSQVLNLDALLQDDLKVILGGKEYQVPSDIDLSMAAQIISVGKELEGDPTQETVRRFEQLLVDLLSIRQKPPETVRITLGQAMALIKAVTSASERMAEKAVPFAKS